jgi:hypothetical protein
LDVAAMSLRHSLQDAAEAFASGEARTLGADIHRPGHGGDKLERGA